MPMPLPVIQWLFPGGVHGGACEYTARLLSSLIPCRAVCSDSLSAAESLPTVCYGCDPPGGGDRACLRIQPDRGFWNAVQSGTDVTPQGRSGWQGTVFPTWSHGAAAQSEGVSPNDASCTVDPIAAAFFLVSRIEEWRAQITDRHDRFPADRAWMVQQELIERPLVHEYAQAIARVLGVHLESAADRIPWPRGRRFAVAFTHDIDRLHMHGPWWQELRSAAGAMRFAGGMRAAARRLHSRARVRWGGRPDPYDTIEEIVTSHQQHDYRSTFFWIYAAPSVRNADYDCRNADVMARLRSLRERGFEVGIHGSYDSYQDERILGAEREGLEQASGAEVTSIRQHYLRFNPRRTWAAQVAAGLRIDSSLGFAGRMGFRAGLAVPFRPWDFSTNRPFDLFEVPLVMMDGTMKEYMALTPEEATIRSRRILSEIARVGGACALLWHNSSLNKIDWAGWSPVYQAWLQDVEEFGGAGASVKTIADLWSDYLQSLGLA